MQLLRRFSSTLLLMLLMTLVGCGGGDGDLTGGDDGNGTPTNDNFNISLSLSSTNVSVLQPIIVSATLTGNNTTSGKVISFSSSLGTFSPTSATALTDSNGIAQITLTAGDIAGAGEITASLSSGESASIGFTTEGDDIDNVGDTTIALSMSDSNVSFLEPAVVTVTLSGDTSVAGKLVSFSSSLGVFSPNSATALTDSNGIAQITLTAGNIAGAGEVTASLSSGETASIGFTTEGDDVGNIGDTSIALSISDSNVSFSEPAVVTVTLSGNNSVAGKLVSFSSSLGAFSPNSATALTDSNGIAQITLTAGNIAGAGEVTASLSSGETASIGFTTAGDDIGNAGNININLFLSNINVTGEAPIVVSAALSGAESIEGRLVSFSSTLGAFSPSVGTALTDNNGIAQITLTAGTIKGAGEITAQLSSGESATVAFTTQGDDVGNIGDTNIVLSLLDVEGSPATTITASQPGRIIAKVNGINSPVIVTFTSTVGEIPIATAITDEDNEASVDIFATGSLGAGTITASIFSGETGVLLLVVGSSTVTMGSGDPFVESVADISLEEISAGGTTVVTVNIIDDQGNLFTEPVEVNFSSSCVTQSTATLSSPVTTSNGIATSTYLAKGCIGDDPINVTASAGGINLSANTTVNVLPADIGSIEFVSATPENIGLLGTGIVGGSESATVIFRVKDTDGNPYNNREVNFALNTNVGGLNLSQTKATSDAQGLVQTVINSGTVATTIRVTASTGTNDDKIVFTQSSSLVVSTGLPDQDSFSISRQIANPEAWDIDGLEVPVMVLMADAFNNPVPDGTAVNFTTEGGSIESSCTTTNGGCSVMWKSQNPRPAGKILTNNFCTLADDADPQILCARVPLSSGKNYLGQEYGGRATILATAIGEESFPDKNNNGRFDESEYALFQGLNVSDRAYDLKEAFVDHNEDRLYNPVEISNEIGGELEEFVDFNSDGVFNIEDAAYNGVLCGFNDITNPGTVIANQYCADPDDEPDPTKKSEKVSTNVRGSQVIIMSGNDPYITVIATNDGVTEGSANDDATDLSLYLQGKSTGTVSIVVADFHNQPMPAGTIISFEASEGSIVGPSSYTWGSDDNNGGRVYNVAVQGADEPASGLLIIKIEAPSGLTTTINEIKIIIF